MSVRTSHNLMGVHDHSIGLDSKIDNAQSKDNLTVKLPDAPDTKNMLSVKCNIQLRGHSESAVPAVKRTHLGGFIDEIKSYDNKREEYKTSILTAEKNIKGIKSNLKSDPLYNVGVLWAFVKFSKKERAQYAQRKRDLVDAEKNLNKLFANSDAHQSNFKRSLATYFGWGYGVYSSGGEKYDEFVKEVESSLKKNADKPSENIQLCQEAIQILRNRQGDYLPHFERFLEAQIGIASAALQQMNAQR